MGITIPMSDTRKPYIAISLDDSEVQLAKTYAELRYQAARGMGAQYNKMTTDDRSKMDNEIHSFCGELAACKALNIYPSLSFVSDNGAIPTVDAYWMNGTVDIKTTKYLTGRLMVTVKKSDEKRCDFYFLVVGDIPDFRLVGWIGRETLFQEKNLTDPGQGVCYALDQEDLRCFDRNMYGGLCG